MESRAEHLYDFARHLEEGRVTHLGAAILLYQASAELQYEPAIIRLAYLLDAMGHRGLRRGIEKAMIAIRNASRIGDVRSMRRYLSYLSYYGDGGQATSRFAGSLLMSLVEKGDPLTLANVGRGRWDSLTDTLENSEMVFPVIDRLECLKKAAEMGVMTARTKLAEVMYESVDVGEKVDDAVWANLLESVESGDFEALVYLHGWMWKSWDSAPLDLEELAAVAEDYALHHGDAVACAWLATAFLEGSPLPRDQVVSCRYFRRFCGLGGLLSTYTKLPELFGERLCVRTFYRGWLDRLSLSVWPPARRVLKIRE